jgi:TolB protein
VPARRTRRAAALAVVVAFPAAAPADAQWTNRYPKQAGYAHHVYFEGYELPVTAVGPSDPAPSPDGRSVAVASRGWLWLLDLASGEARRLTRGAGVDSRPAWSPDGRTLAFVRDDGRTTAVMTLDVTSGAEREVERGLALDPAFAPDGRSVYYASSSAGDLDLWRAELATGREGARDVGRHGDRAPPAAARRRAARALPQQDARRRGRGAGAPARGGGAETTLLSGNILSQLRPAPSPDGRLLAYNWPGTDGWELRLTSLERPGPSVLLVGRPGGRPLAPAWSRDRAWVYFAESDGAQRMRLYRVSAAGGAAAEVPVRRWAWGAPTGRLVVRTRGLTGARSRRGWPSPTAPGTPRSPTAGRRGSTARTGSTTSTRRAPSRSRCRRAR